MPGPRGPPCCRSTARARSPSLMSTPRTIPARSDSLPADLGLTASRLNHRHGRTGGNRSLPRKARRSAGLNDLAFLRRFRSAALVPHRQSGALLDIQRRVRSLHPALVRGIFPAVDRADMRRISAEIGPADAEFLAVLVDPLPEGFGGNPALRPGRAVDADDVGREPMAVAAAEAAAME